MLVVPATPSGNGLPLCTASYFYSTYSLYLALKTAVDFLDVGFHAHRTLTPPSKL